MARTFLISFSLLIFLGASADTYAQARSEEDELAGVYGDKSVVSIATGSQQPIAKAPSSATVITARDIEAMGATDLRQVLEGVPGLHVSTVGEGYFPRFEIRGLTSEYGVEVLMLVNGFKINTNFQGVWSFVVGQMPVANISRIEIIRGPGSALYGADAFSGVINIITKSPDEISGTEIGGRYGSFRSKDLWLLHGGKVGIFDAAVYLQVGNTAGQKRTVERDLQSIIDDGFGTHVSHAPGPLNVESQSIDANIDLSHDEWRFRLGYQKRKNGPGLGLAPALDLVGKIPEQRLNFDLSYQKANFLPFLDVNASLSYFRLAQDQANPSFILLPAGTFGGLFPDGFIGNPGHKERDTRFALSMLYTKFNSHKIRFGIGHETENLYETAESKNFTYINGVLTPLGQVVDATGNPDLVYLLPQKRSLSYAFLQDEWNFAKDWNLTAGVRHDRYSDFGTTTNPRLALVWDAAYNLVVKALHGRAFRAPSFVEEFSINNPTNQGNPNLKPERVRTTELAAVWQTNPSLQSSLTLFHYAQSDIIRYISFQGNGQLKAANTGGQTGKGFELELQWDIARNLRLTGNYSYQKSIDDATNKDAGLTPHHHLFVRTDWRFAPSWQMGASFNAVLDRKRQPDDPRPYAVPNYTSVDLSLRREKLWGNWEFEGSVKNLFNRDIREPSSAPGNVPFDLPQAGRAIYAQLVYKFK